MWPNKGKNPYLDISKFRSRQWLLHGKENPYERDLEMELYSLHSSKESETREVREQQRESSPQRSRQIAEGVHRPDQFGDLKYRNDYPKKAQALQEHPDRDCGDGGSYFYGGPPLKTKFRPSFIRPQEHELPALDLVSQVAESYMQTAPLHLQTSRPPVMIDLSRQEIFGEDAFERPNSGDSDYEQRMQDLQSKVQEQTFGLSATFLMNNTTAKSIKASMVDTDKDAILNKEVQHSRDNLDTKAQLPKQLENNDDENDDDDEESSGSEVGEEIKGYRPPSSSNRYDL